MSIEKELTVLLNELEKGKTSAVDAIIPLIYNDLRERAHRFMQNERSNHTLNTTALVHEAYLKLIGQSQVSWQNRAHFFGVASLVMRRILINYAKQKKAARRGGGVTPQTFLEEFVITEERSEMILALDEALERLAGMNERQSKVVELRFFGGLTHEEIAEVLGVSEPTVRRDWRFARAWLNRELTSELTWGEDGSGAENSTTEDSGTEASSGEDAG